MAAIYYSAGSPAAGLEPDGLRLSSMIEAEVRAQLADMASIRTGTDALLFAGDVAGSGSDAVTLRFAGYGAKTPMASAAEDADVSATSLTTATSTITVARNSLRYDITDTAVLTGLGADIDPFLLASSMAMSAEARFMEIICSTFTSASTSVGTATVDMSVDDFMDAIFALEIADNNGNFYAVLAPRQWADLQNSLRSESNNALAFSPAVEAAIGAKGQGYQGSLLGVEIFRSSRVQNSSPAGNKIGAMFSSGAIGYAIGTPRPLAGAGAEVRPAGTPVVVGFERDESKALTEVVGHLYCGAAIAQDAQIVKIVTDA
tara:strand:- start:1506 stop:2456 length:951 start_codon:yes stop_codon:yes gene_type:complete